MLSDEALDILGEKVSQRIESLNIYMLKEIGNQIKTIGSLTPTQAYQILQSVKYGNDINKITKEIARVTKLTQEDIYIIFEEVAKRCEAYSKPFLEYRNINYIPFEENVALQNQVRAIADVYINQFNNLMNSSAFIRIDNLGNKILTPTAEIYQRITEEAVLSIQTGRESYIQAIDRATKELAKQGIQSVDYTTKYHRRLDSSVRMNVLEGVRNISQTLLNQFGEQFGADGIQVSHHINSAPDHIDTVDGKQFTKEEYQIVNSNLDRPVGTLNCYHFAFPIIKGVSNELYDKEQIKEDKEKNMDGFEYEGIHYTNYEGTQLQRKIETQIRKNKDAQIFELSRGNEDKAYIYQRKVTALGRKYRELSKISGLPTRNERIKVSGYKRIGK